jgi:hypothetical protein
MAITPRSDVEITEADIERLEGFELRELVGRLCQADLCRAGYPINLVSWSSGPTLSHDDSYVHLQLPPDVLRISACWTGESIFDCRSRVDTDSDGIHRALNLEGSQTLRPALAELFSRGGAYILVSAQGTTEPFLIHCNLKAMRRAIELDGCVSLDFFDRVKVMSWTRTHPNVVLCLKQLIESKGESTPYGPLRLLDRGRCR